MAKAKSTTRATSAQRAALVAAGLASATPERDKAMRLRRWACKIVSDLPTCGDDGQRVLDLAGELLRGWASKVGRAAR